MATQHHEGSHCLHGGHTGVDVGESNLRCKIEGLGPYMLFLAGIGLGLVCPEPAS